MRTDRYASVFLWLAAAMLFMFAGAMIISVGGLGVQMPVSLETIDSAHLDEIPGFAEPGLQEIDEGRYEVYMIVSADAESAFNPSEITVPVGSQVTFIVTSEDVIHNLKVTDTTINLTVIPGQIAEVTYTFNRSGDYEFYCNENCGSLLAGVIHVVED